MPEPPRAPLVKICGLVRPEEARACAELGAGAVGVVLAPGGPRHLTPEEAAEVLAAVPGGVWRVGVFVRPSEAQLASAVARCGLTHVQIHDCADPAAARAAAGVPVVEAVAVDGAAAVERARRSAADLVLLDAAVPERHGGTGRRFDWGILERSPVGRPFALAGGLDPDVVADAVRRLRPAAVDVSSGVEYSPGRKDLRLVARFIEEARAGMEANG